MTPESALSLLLAAARIDPVLMEAAKKVEGERQALRAALKSACVVIWETDEDLTPEKRAVLGKAEALDIEFDMGDN